MRVMSRRGRRILVLTAGVAVALLLLQDPAGAASTEPGTDGERPTSTLTPDREPDDDVGDDDRDRSVLIAVGMVVAAAAIGGLLLLSKP